jgi:hypothetical protein
MEKPEYAIVIDDTYDACVLRDALRSAAKDRAAKAAKATQRSALKRNKEEHRILAMYAQRCEDIRLEEARRMGRLLSPEKGAPHGD